MSGDNTFENIPKQTISEAERIDLAKKMDKELDAFIDGLERKRYEDGWPEDRWQEEMEKHPFFMKSAQQEGQMMSPLAEGLAQLKYDPAENTATELALNYKEDGNFNYKHKNYRLAIIGYTEGITTKCGDPEIAASLYNNRAACHWELKNFRSCLADSEKALSFKPDHRKARLRAIRAATITSKFAVATSHCKILLQETPTDKQVLEMLTTAREGQGTLERDTRKKYIAEQKRLSETKELVSAIWTRALVIDKVEDGDDLDLSALEPTIPAAVGARVRLENDVLLWPILIMYPEFSITDFIKDCPENLPLIGQLEQLFPAPWDEKNEYRITNLNVYFEGSNRKIQKVDSSLHLGDVLKMKHFVVRGGTPSFIILVKDSKAEQAFLKSNSM